MSLKRRLKKKLGETDVRYGGRTLKLEVLINTDEDVAVVAQRIRSAALGPKGRMSVVTCGIVTSGADELWASVAAAAAEQVTKEN